VDSLFHLKQSLTAFISELVIVPYRHLSTVEYIHHSITSLYVAIETADAA